jgi:hypothetical protein
MRSIGGALLVVAWLAGAASASAQETGTPAFKAPYRAFEDHEFGGTLSDAEGIDYALEGYYRYGRGDQDFSIRGGYADVGGDQDVAVLIGGDFRTKVLSYSDDFPMDGALTLGFGGIFGEGDDRYLLPIGISLGRRFDMEGSNTTFVPYLHPILVPSFGSDDSDVDFALGLGVDMRFSQSFAIRASGGLGDIEGVSIGAAYIR